MSNCHDAYPLFEKVARCTDYGSRPPRAERTRRYVNQYFAITAHWDSPRQNAFITIQLDGAPRSIEDPPLERIPWHRQRAEQCGAERPGIPRFHMGKLVHKHETLRAD